MQVHEIGRSALSNLRESGKIHDMANGHGEYVVVGAIARFDHGTPNKFFLVENFEDAYWACRRCKGMNDSSLSNALNGMKAVAEYEVWHVVEDDEPFICYCVVPFRKYDDRYNEDIVEAPNGEFCFETEQEAIHFAKILVTINYPDDNEHLLFSKVDVIKDVDHLETPIFTYIFPSKAAKVVSF